MNRTALLLAIVGLGCNSAHSGTDLPVASAAGAFEVLGATPALAGSVEGAWPLTRVGEGFQGPRGGPLAVDLPGRAGGVMHLSNTATPDAWVDVAPEGVEAVAASLAPRGVAFVGALDDGDIALLASPLFVEDARILRGAGRHVARYRLGLGPAVASVRAREGRIECVDARGKVLLGTAPIFAVDAGGTRVELSPRVTMGDRGAHVEITLDAPGLVPPIVIDPVWSTVSPMAQPRWSPGTVVLSDGKILVAGGNDATSTTTRSAEVYDPASNTWTTVGSMLNEHARLRLVLLASGRVLTAANMPEIYDPVSRSWSPAGASSPSYVGSAGFLAKTGKAVTFFHYGDSPAAMAFTRIYDEGSNTWSSGAPLPTRAAAPARPCSPTAGCSSSAATTPTRAPATRTPICTIRRPTPGRRRRHVRCVPRMPRTSRCLPGRSSSRAGTSRSPAARRPRSSSIPQPPPGRRSRRCPSTIRG